MKNFQYEIRYKTGDKLFLYIAPENTDLCKALNTLILFSPTGIVFESIASVTKNKTTKKMLYL